MSAVDLSFLATINGSTIVSARRMRVLKRVSQPRRPDALMIILIKSVI